MVKKKMYKRIQELKKKGYGKLEIGRKLRLDPATVRKYYNMSGDEYRKYQLERLTREKVFEDYKEEILGVYESNGNRKLNMSAVYDYLEERFVRLPGGVFFARSFSPELQTKFPRYRVGNSINFE